MIKLLDRIDNKEGYLVLNEDGNLYLINKNISKRVKLKEITYRKVSKEKTLREIFLSIYKKELYRKSRNKEKTFELFVEGELLKDFKLMYYIYNDSLSIAIRTNSYSDMRRIELINRDIDEILEDTNEYENEIEKIMLNMKNINLKKTSNEMIELNKQIKYIENKYGFGFKKETYSIEKCKIILLYVDKMMKNINTYIRFNNPDFTEEVNNKNLVIKLKRSKDRSNIGLYQYGLINLNMESIGKNIAYLESSFVHEYGHHLDAMYLRVKNMQKYREEFIWKLLRNNMKMLNRLAKSYIRTSKDESKNEKLIIKEIKDYKTFKEFYSSKYYKLSYDYTKYELNHMEIIARMFEQLYYEKVGNKSLIKEESKKQVDYGEFSKEEMNEFKVLLSKANILI